MVNTIIVSQTLIIFDLAETGVVCDQVEHVGWVVRWLESHHLQVVVLECHEVLSPACLDVSDHAVALLTEGLVHDDSVCVAQDLTHHSSSFLGTNGVIVYTFFIFTNFIESIDIM